MAEEQDDWSKYEKFVLAELGRIGDGFDSLREGQSQITTHLQDYNSELRLHIRGVLALERRNEIAEKQFNAFRQEVDLRLERAEAPLVYAVMTREIAKVVFILGSCVGLIYAGMKFMWWF